VLRRNGVWKMEGLVSVIVPIYNAGKYLEQCIESIQKQVYDKIEIILVNDGSTDGSGEICDVYAEGDARIKVIHKKNGGNTSARRAGLENAAGEYIVFVDADDAVSEFLVNDLLCEMKRSHADMVISNVTKRFPYGDIEVKNKILPGVYQKSNDIIRNMFYYEETDEFGVLPYLVAKMYKYNFIYKGFCEFKDSIQYAEDRALTFWCILNAEKVSFIDKSYYRYNINEDGLCLSQDERYLEKITEFYIYVKRLFEGQAESRHLLKQLDKYMVNAVVSGINRKIGLSQNDLIVKYYLDESKLKPSRNVVLYGAGNVGRDFYKQLLRSENVHVSAWVDYNYQKYEKEKLPVESLNRLKDLEYDYIIVAVLRENVYENIAATLENYSVPRDKVIWEKPITMF